MIFRHAIGWFCAAAAVAFLSINSGILARGASKWGYDTWERISYGTVAATVPWVIAIMPFLIVYSWRPGKRMGRPSIATLVGCGIWLVFVAYNLIGAAGSVAAVRDEVLSHREHAAGNLKADRATRKRLTDELDNISRYRPADAVAALLAAERAKPNWEWTQKCTDIRKGRDQRFCGVITSLEAELASAKRARELSAQLAQLDGRLASADPASEKVDPQARIIHNLTGWSEEWISERLPIATPIVLELGSMTLLYFSFVLLGLSHHRVMHSDQLVRRTVQHDVKQSGLPLLASTMNPKRASTLTRQRELADWFFRECVRHAADGSLSQAKWYEHYQAVCAESNDTPLPLASFHRFATRYIPEIKDIDGVTYYRGVLPYLPKRVINA